MNRRRPDPDVARRLVDAAARLLAEDGPGAVSARRLAAEVGASTMVVYTHFGSMDEVVAVVCREGFRRFAAALERTRLTDDPVADWMAQGWSYRRFALDEPHLYQAMFSPQTGLGPGSSEEDAEAAAATFQSLLRRLDRCREAGRWDVADLRVAGEVVWAGVHGLALIELGGFFTATGRDPRDAHVESMERTALGYGDDPAQVRRSLDRARRRAVRADLL